jgi:hypothetical protein
MGLGCRLLPDSRDLAVPAAWVADLGCSLEPGRCGDEPRLLRPPVMRVLGKRLGARPTALTVRASARNPGVGRRCRIEGA